MFLSRYRQAIISVKIVRLQRMSPYIDVVLCQDIEAVTNQDVIKPTVELLRFMQHGIINWVGILSYRIDILIKCALLIREPFGIRLNAVKS